MNNDVHTVIRVLWLNDVLNHPKYYEFVTLLYEYITWGEKERERLENETTTLANKLKTKFENFNTNKVLNKIKQQKKNFDTQDEEVKKRYADKGQTLDAIIRVLEDKRKDIFNENPVTGEYYWVNYIDPNELFLIKEIQILFYLNEWENLNQKIDTFLKSELKMTNYYNDILKIKNYIAIFGDNKEELESYSKSLMKRFQNKRYESIKIIGELTKNNDIEISSKMKYEHAYLLIKQNNIEEAISILNTVDNESAIIESSILLKAEMYDYILDDTSNAVDLYIYLLENYPNSIYYDLIRLRLREITS